MDTIFALSTAPGKAGVAIIRMSGPKAHGAVEALCGSVPAARRAVRREIRGLDGVRLDEALVLVFEDGASFTGELVAELQVHGSMAVINAILHTLRQLNGLTETWQ